MAGHSYPDKSDACKDAVGIPGISMTYVLNKSLENNKGLELDSPGGIWHLCRDIREELQRCSCNGYCEECQLDMKNLEKCKCEKTAVYDLLRTGMVGGPAQVFTRYHGKDITRIRFHVYGKKSELTKGIIDYDANVISLLFRRCNALWQRHAECEKEAIRPKTNCKIFRGCFKRKSFCVCTGSH